MVPRMSYEYDHSFSPFVVPGGLSADLNAWPDARWLGLMVRSQAGAALGERLIGLRQRLPWALRQSRLARVVESAAARWIPEAPGRIPTQDDAAFAYQRFAGNNPLQIARARSLEDIPEKLRLSREVFGRALGVGATFEARVARGDVFVLQYEALRVRSAGDLQKGKFVASARALFGYAPEVDSPFPVVPLAIECAVGRPEGETAVFTPADGERWRAARRVVGVADVNTAEICVHLARAHCMTTPFAIALRRTLAPSHPLRVFLQPHLRFNLFVDRMAWLQGVRSTEGILIRSLAGSARWSQDVARSVYFNHSFREQHFERDLCSRGLDAHPVDYPYRDDGRLLWAAIRRLCERYVHRTYADDASVAGDAALGAFVADVTAPRGGNVRGLLAGERLDTRDELTEVLTQVVFVAGPLHALAHYASAAQLQAPEENPAFLVDNPLSAADDHAEPGALGAMHQYTRVTGTNCQYDTLGDFSRHPFGQLEDCRAMIAEFQAALRDAEEEIAARNLRRYAPFIHFLPSRISNGITV